MENNLPPQQNQAQESGDEILPEYDFSQGVRGKHWQAYQRAIATGTLKIDSKLPLS
ncbi:hypothetical protein GS597_06795 [Synechococcales cyanobacterium C]|uniref:Uncharacterized protein n=1 Tax=Petrachloros mirabilis ULC683 TaxID=2781853 RepID=A0A8K2A6P5_9CYAN|nr:hypothetical protein [Petrachloros mirabilis]NCJ06229.1 hypothetical protein [Petrachloros mirabilis ULC683]